MTDDGWASFHVLIGYLYIFLEKCLFTSFAHFKVRYSWSLKKKTHTVVKISILIKVRIVVSPNSSEEFLIRPEWLLFRYIYGCLEVRGMGETEGTKRPEFLQRTSVPCSLPPHSTCSPFFLSSYPLFHLIYAWAVLWTRFGLAYFQTMLLCSFSDNVWARQIYLDLALSPWGRCWSHKSLPLKYYRIYSQPLVMVLAVCVQPLIWLILICFWVHVCIF